MFETKSETRGSRDSADGGADTKPESTDAELSVSKSVSDATDNSGLAKAPVVAEPPIVEKTPVIEVPEQTLGDQDTPTFQVSAKLVEISVVARDEKGNLVKDLSQRDFAIYDHGKPQSIRLFKTNESPAPASSTKTPQATQTSEAASLTSFSNHGQAGSQQGAINVILFNELNTVWTDQVYARNQVIKFLSQMNPKERIGLYLLSSRGPQIVQDITTDSSELIRVLAARASGTQVFPSFTTELHPSNTTLGLARWLDGKDHGFRFFQLQGSPDPLTAAANQSQSNFLFSMRMLTAVINHLSGVPGCKNLIWISPNFQDFANLQSHRNSNGYSNEILTAAMRVAVEANVSLYPIDARGLIADPGYSAAERDVPVPWAIRKSVRDYNLTLATMLDEASRTGGRALISNNDIAGAIRRQSTTRILLIPSASIPRL